MDPSKIRNNKRKFDQRKYQEKPVFRELAFSREAVNVEARTVEIAWASEVPYERWWGVEILDCGADSIRLARMQNKASLLFNHNWDRLIGVVEQVSIGADKVCRAVVRFGKGADADQHFQDVVDGILTKVSVGYMIHKMVLEESGDDVDSVYRITDWEPFEVSMVTVPADDSVGLGRNMRSEDDSKADDEKSDDENKSEDEDESKSGDDDEAKTDDEQEKESDDEKSDDEKSDDETDKSDDENKHLNISVTERKKMSGTTDKQDHQVDAKRREALIEMQVIS